MGQTGKECAKKADHGSQIMSHFYQYQPTIQKSKPAIQKLKPTIEETNIYEKQKTPGEYVLPMEIWKLIELRKSTF